jgi:hypothetical protein
VFCYLKREFCYLKRVFCVIPCVCPQIDHGARPMKALEFSTFII